MTMYIVLPAQRAHDLYSRFYVRISAKYEHTTMNAAAVRRFTLLYGRAFNPKCNLLSFS